MSGYRLCLLGEPALWLGETPVVLPTRKLWALLVYLSVQQVSVSRKKLAEMLWENHGEERSRANLRQELYRLRGELAGGLFVSLEDHLSLASHHSDVREVLAQQRAQNWAAVLNCYQGEFAQGLTVRGATDFEDWLALEREHWSSLWRDAARRQGSILETGGHHSEARGLYGRILKQDPFQEDLQRAAMMLTAQLEGAEAALKMFEAYKALLRHEFSLDPLAQTLDLAARLASGRDSNHDATDAVLTNPLNNPALVGREREWAAMEAAWQNGKAIYLSGPPGIGKTRLMLEFSASKGSCIHFEARRSDTDVPFGYVARTLRQALDATHSLEMPAWMQKELSRLYPELGEDPPAMTGETDKLRFFEALTEVVRRLSEVGVLAIIADDIQFVGDTTSVEFVSYSMERILPLGKLHSITTFRSDEMHPAILEGIEQQVQQGIAVRIELEPLDEQGASKFVQSLSGQAAPIFSRRLYQSTGGNPLFMLETVRSLFSTGEIQIEDGHWHTLYDQETETYRELPIPKSVRDAVLKRVDRLGGGVKRLLEAASLVGESVRLDELAGATALSEWETLDALETALNAGLLRPIPDGFGFSHDLVRKALSEGMSVGRARLLHQKLAAALERLDGTPGRIAHHLERAGKPKQAVTWRVQAAQQATRVFALREALDHYAKALENGPDSTTAFSIRQARIELWADLSDFQEWANEIAHLDRLAAHDPDLESQAALARIELASRSSRYQEALEIATGLLERPDLQSLYKHRALRARGNSLLQLGKTSEAKKNLEAALEGLPPELVGIRGSIHISLLVCFERLGDLTEALSHGRESLRVAGDDTQVRIQGLDSMGRIHLRQGHHALALEHFSKALDLARSTQHVYMQRQILLNLFGVYHHLGDVAAGIVCLEEGLALTQAPQDQQTEGTFLSNLGFSYRQRGDLGKAIQHTQAAIAVADQIAMPFQQAWRRITLADLLLDIGAESAATRYLEEADGLIVSAHLDALTLWCEAVRLRAILSKSTTDSSLLEGLLNDAKGSVTDQDRARWTLGMVRLGQHDFSAALQIAERLTQSTFMRSRGLALELRARNALNSPLDESIRRAEELLGSDTLPPLESLELRQALQHVLRQKRKSARHFQIARHQAQTLASSLGAHPEFQRAFHQLYKALLY